MDLLPDLDRTAAELAKVRDEGLLSELKESIADALQGRPRSDFDAHPGLKWDVDAFGGLLAEFTGMPLDLCKLAALNQLLPSNRSRVALEVLQEFAERIGAETAKQTAVTIISAERRRVAKQGRRAS